MRDAFAGVDRALVLEVDPARRCGQDLARPVRCKWEVRCFGTVRHSLSTPAREIGDEDLVAEVQLRLGEDPPSTRAAAALAERRAELEAEERGSDGVRRRRPRVRVERPVDDFGDLVRGRVEHVLIGCPCSRERFAPRCSHVEVPVPGSDPIPTRG